MMQPSAAADGLAQGAGAAVASRVRPEGPTSWLVPAWSVLCGVIASGAFGWQGRPEWLRLALLMLLVEAGWTALWSALGNSDWAAPVAAWRDWPRQGRAAPLPYTLPGTPGDRSAHWLGQLRAWWSRCLWPTYGAAITTAVAAFLSTVVLALLLGPEIALLSIAAIAAMQIGLASERGRGRVTPGWNAVVTVLLPWLAGHVAFAPLTIASAWSAASAPA